MILSRVDELIRLAKQYMNKGYNVMDAIKLAEIVLDELERREANERD